MANRPQAPNRHYQVFLTFNMYLNPDPGYLHSIAKTPRFVSARKYFLVRYKFKPSYIL